MVLRWMVGCSFVLLLWLGFHANLPVSNSTWLGPVGENYTISPAGSGRSPFQDNARRHLHNRQNRSHAPHRAGTLQGKCGLIDFCINNGIIGTGGIRLCPDRVEALIYWKIGASGLWLC